MTDAEIKAIVNSTYINNLISPTTIENIMNAAYDHNYYTTIASNYITTQFVGALAIESLGRVTAGSFNIGNKFVVDSSGNLTASNVKLTGEINATSGKIGGFNIVNNVLTSTGNDYIELSGTVLKFYKNGALQYDLGPGGITLKGGDATINGATTSTITLANN